MPVKSDDVASPREQLGQFVSRQVNMVQSIYLSATGQSKGARELAALRRAVTKFPGAAVDTWQLEFDGLPEALVGRGDEPSAGEWAGHAALTLYAAHQQSQTFPMHQRGEEHGLGQAMREFVQRNANRFSNLEQGELPRRFAALVTAESFSETVHYARQLVHQLRSAAIPLDYALLAQQLYDLQIPGRADAVRLAWGRGFAMYQGSGESEKNQSSSRLGN